MRSSYREGRNGGGKKYPARAFRSLANGKDHSRAASPREGPLWPNGDGKRLACKKRSLIYGPITRRLTSYVYTYARTLALVRARIRQTLLPVCRDSRREAPAKRVSVTSGHLSRNAPACNKCKPTGRSRWRGLIDETRALPLALRRRGRNLVSYDRTSLFRTPLFRTRLVCPSIFARSVLFLFLLSSFLCPKDRSVNSLFPLPLPPVQPLFSSFLSCLYYWPVQAERLH